MRLCHCALQGKKAGMVQAKVAATAMAQAIGVNSS
jgi:hypothetical protein